MTARVLAEENRSAIIMEEARQALERRDCKSAWDMTWPLAKAGDPLARHFLYNAFSIGALGWPGITSDHTFYFRSALVITMYAAVTPRNDLTFRFDPDRHGIRRHILTTIRSEYMKMNADGKRVEQCYAEGSSFQKCLDLATSLGVVPKFEDFARETEDAERSTGVAAHCPPRH
jgi:hypothetical protein